MSHRTFASALAIALVFGAMLPAALASDQPAYVRIASPGEGDVLLSNGSVVVEYHTDEHFSARWGEVLLDDVVVGAFQSGTMPLAGPVFMNVTLKGASNLTRGLYALTARLHGENETTIVSPAVGVLLNHPPAVSVNATYDPAAQVLAIRGAASDDAGAVTLSVGSPLGNATLEANGLYLLEQHGLLRPGQYYVSVVARDSDGAEARTATTAFVADNEAVFEILNITAERGERLHVHGRVSDPDGAVSSVVLSTAFGSASSRVVDGMFWFEMPMRATVGIHTATFVSKDPFGGVSNTTARFEVRGIARVFYEEEIKLGVGASVNVDFFSLPARSHGEVRICYVWNGTCSYGGLGEVVVDIGNAILDTSSTRCVGGILSNTGGCKFDARTDGTFGKVAWALGGPSRVRVMVTGFEIV